jgi:hypothetical protein
MAAAQMIFPAVCFAGNHCPCVAAAAGCCSLVGARRAVPYAGYCALTGLGVVVRRDFGSVFGFLMGHKKMSKCALSHSDIFFIN